MGGAIRHNNKLSLLLEFIFNINDAYAVCSRVKVDAWCGIDGFELLPVPATN